MFRKQSRALTTVAATAAVILSLTACASAGTPGVSGSVAAAATGADDPAFQDGNAVWVFATVSNDNSGAPKVFQLNILNVESGAWRSFPLPTSYSLGSPQYLNSAKSTIVSSPSLEGTTVSVMEFWHGETTVVAIDIREVTGDFRATVKEARFDVTDPELLHLLTWDDIQWDVNISSPDKGKKIGAVIDGDPIFKLCTEVLGTDEYGNFGVLYDSAGQSSCMAADRPAREALELQISPQGDYEPTPSGLKSFYFTNAAKTMWDFTIEGGAADPSGMDAPSNTLKIYTAKAGDPDWSLYDKAITVVTDVDNLKTVLWILPPVADQ